MDSKENYNNLKERLKKADVFFEQNPSRCKGKLLEEYNNIVREISNSIFYDKKDF